MAYKLEAKDIKKIGDLRLDKGMSIREIEAATGFSKATISKYCSGLRNNNKIKTSNRAAALAIKRKWGKKRESVVASAIEFYEKHKNDHRFKSFVALYWAEGCKRSNSFALPNSDPGIIKFIYDYVRELGYEVYVCVSIYEQQNDDEVKKAWEDIGIPIHKIYKYKMRTQHRLYSKHGVARVAARKSFRIYHSVMTWIDCWRHDIGLSNSWQL